MGCWCGHGPWHHWGPGHGCGYGQGHGYGPGYGYGPGPGYGYGPGYGPGVVREPRRRRARVDDLEDYLRDLEDEVAAVRTELEDLKGRRGDQ